VVNFLFIEGLELDFFNPRSLIVFICILQGAIFAALLLVRYYKQKKTADFWLAALLLLLCSSLVTPLIGFANVYDRNQWLTFFPFGVTYGYGVCIWFYVLTLTDSRRRIERRDWLLFIPSLVYLVFRFYLFAQTVEFKGRFSDDYYNPYINPLIVVTEFAWNLGLLYFSIRHYRKYRAWLDQNYSDTEKIKFDWLRNFLYIFTFIFILGAVFDFTGSFFVRLSYIQYFYFEFVLALVTYYLGIAGYLRSQPIEVNFSEAESERIEAVDEDERRALMPDRELEKNKARLRELMSAEKPHLDSQLTLTALARMLGLNASVLSYVINHGFGVNFNDFVNEFRIAEVKAKLNDAAAENSNLLGVALDCGFNSKATFNRAFKKFTGVSPRQYQEGRKPTPDSRAAENRPF
jgi:AraC-like DNA-binding protein